jgi:hypothetical protein
MGDGGAGDRPDRRLGVERCAHACSLVESCEFTWSARRERSEMTRPPCADDDAERRVPIGESAADEDDAPSGLPPEPAQDAATVDDDPESQETG